MTDPGVAGKHTILQYTSYVWLNCNCHSFHLFCFCLGWFGGSWQLPSDSHREVVRSFTQVSIRKGTCARHHRSYFKNIFFVGYLWNHQLDRSCLEAHEMNSQNNGNHGPTVAAETCHGQLHRAGNPWIVGEKIRMGYCGWHRRWLKHVETLSGWWHLMAFNGI